MKRDLQTHLFLHFSGEEEVWYCSDEEETGGHQEAKPPGPHPAQVFRGQFNFIWKENTIVS